MTEEELWDALDGLSAYAHGATDSGIHDEDLRQEVIDHLEAMDPDARRLTIGRFVRDHKLSEEAMAEGYGPADALQFLTWLDRDMGADFT